MNSHKSLSLLISILIQTCFTIPFVTAEFPLPDRFKTSSESVFIEFNALLGVYHPLNLGQGAPDYPPPRHFQTAVANVATSSDASLSQYSNDVGHPRLLKAVSKLYSKLLNRTVDPNKNVIITVGAFEALFISILSNTFHGQEWIVFEPYFEHYNPMIKAAHGIPRFIKLKPKSANSNESTADWTFDKDELRNLFNNKTKGILLNTPHNPLGKVFSLEEITFIADLAKKWDVLVLADEVYRFLTFDNNKHISIASLPGMFERTITVGSAGKMFGATGYRLGWAYGDAKLIDNLKPIHSIVVSCAPTPTQEAVAVALEQEISDLGKSNSFLEHLRKEIESNRNYLYRTLKKVGMTPILPGGGYFMVANWTTIGDNVVLNTEKNECEDYKFGKWLIKNVKVLGLPMSSFYREVKECAGKDLMRFTIIKGKKTYETAAKLFSKWKLEQ